MSARIFKSLVFFPFSIFLKRNYTFKVFLKLLSPETYSVTFLLFCLPIKRQLMSLEVAVKSSKNP